MNKFSLNNNEQETILIDYQGELTFEILHSILAQNNMNVSLSTIRNWVKSGNITYLKSGKIKVSIPNGKTGRRKTIITPV